MQTDRDETKHHANFARHSLPGCEARLPARPDVKIQMKNQLCSYVIQYTFATTQDHARTSIYNIR